MSINRWEPDGGPFEVERPATIDVACFHCQRTTRVLAKRVADAEATYWREKYGRLLAAADAGWVACAERMPRPLQRVLIVDHGSVMLAQCHHYATGAILFEDEVNGQCYTPTHWRPLPVPPPAAEITAEKPEGT